MGDVIDPHFGNGFQFNDPLEFTLDDFNNPEMTQDDCDALNADIKASNLQLGFNEVIEVNDGILYRAIPARNESVDVDDEIIYPITTIQTTISSECLDPQAPIVSNQLGKQGLINHNLLSFLVGDIKSKTYVPPPQIVVVPSARLASYSPRLDLLTARLSRQESSTQPDGSFDRVTTAASELQALLRRIDRKKKQVQDLIDDIVPQEKRGSLEASAIIRGTGIEHEREAEEDESRDEDQGGDLGQENTNRIRKARQTSEQRRLSTPTARKGSPTVKPRRSPRFSSSNSGTFPTSNTHELAESDIVPRHAKRNRYKYTNGRKRWSRTPPFTNEETRFILVAHTHKIGNTKIVASLKEQFGESPNFERFLVWNVSRRIVVAGKDDGRASGKWNEQGVFEKSFDFQRFQRGLLEGPQGGGFLTDGEVREMDVWKNRFRWT